MGKIIDIPVRELEEEEMIENLQYEEWVITRKDYRWYYLFVFIWLWVLFLYLLLNSKTDLESIRTQNLSNAKIFLKNSIENKEKYLKLYKLYNNRELQAKECIYENSIKWVAKDCLIFKK